MKSKLKYLAAVASLGLALLAAAPAQAQVTDATFYELTETMSIDGTTRIGSGALGGQAKVGSPLCPDVLIGLLVQYKLIAGALPCGLTAVGTDTISLLKGDGSLNAKIGVVVEADNPVDAPEYLVMTGSITGGMQVIDAQNRLIQIWGTFTPETVFGYPAADFGLLASPFTGMVRLPFVRDNTGTHRRPHRSERSFYLGDDGKLIRVQQDETALGKATARFELNFPRPTDQ